MPPLGLACLAGALDADGHEVAIIDCVLGGIDNDGLERELRRRRPDVVGITGTTWTRYEQFHAARAARRALPNGRVVLGGPHVTFTARNTLDRLPEIDFVVRGEGEVPMRRLVSAIDDQQQCQAIPSLSFRRDGVVVENPLAEFVSDLDSLPLPARHLLDLPAYRQHLFGRPATTVMTSRGCPVFCAFCSSSVMWGAKYRRRSPSRVMDEIEDLLDRYRLGAVWFFDDTLTLNRQHVVGLLDEMERRRRDFTWYCEIRANTVDLDLLKRMRSLGCRYVSFGVESGSPRMLKRVHKGITLEQVRRVVDWCRDLDIRTKLFFILGLPEETFEDGMMTVALMKELKPQVDQIALAAGCSIMPGTDVERFAVEKGLIGQAFDWTEERYYPENRMNNRPIAVPTLLQPGLGLDELNRLKFEYYGASALNRRNIMARLRALRSPADLWSLLRVGKVFLDYLRRRGRGPWLAPGSTSIPSTRPK